MPKPDYELLHLQLIGNLKGNPQTNIWATQRRTHRETILLLYNHRGITFERKRRTHRGTFGELQRRTHRGTLVLQHIDEPIEKLLTH